MTWVDPRTWLAGEKLSAAKMQTVRDALKEIGDPWTAYTPTWTATTTNPTIGNGTLSGRVMEAGKLVVGSITVVFGSTTTVGSGTYAWTTPTTMQNFRTLNGGCELLDTSAILVVPRILLPVSSNAFAVSDFTPTRVAHNSPIAWGTGDRIDIGFLYEAA